MFFQLYIFEEAAEAPCLTPSMEVWKENPLAVKVYTDFV